MPATCFCWAVCPLFVFVERCARYLGTCFCWAVCPLAHLSSYDCGAMEAMLFFAAQIATHFSKLGEDQLYLLDVAREACLGSKIQDSRSRSNFLNPRIQDSRLKIQDWKKLLESQDPRFKIQDLETTSWILGFKIQDSSGSFCTRHSRRWNLCSQPSTTWLQSWSKKWMMCWLKSLEHWQWIEESWVGN